MSFGGNDFIDFPENQLTKFRAVYTLLRQIRTTRSVQSKLFTTVNVNIFNTTLKYS